MFHADFQMSLRVVVKCFHPCLRLCFLVVVVVVIVVEKEI